MDGWRIKLDGKWHHLLGGEEHLYAACTTTYRLRRNLKARLLCGLFSSKI
jgi:hypothetical protein